MDSVHLESWVKQQYKEVGFGKGGDGPFIGKAAVKQILISHYPMHKVKIRQLVNAIKHEDIPRGSVSTSKQPTVSSQAQRVPTPLPKLLPVGSKKPSQNPNQTQRKVAQPTLDTRLEVANKSNSDSGFASESEDAEKAKSSSKSRKIPTVDFESHSPRSENGGAKLEAISSTGLRFREMTKESGELGIAVQIPSNLKILHLKEFLGKMEGLGPSLQSTTEAMSVLDSQLGLLNFHSAADQDREGTSTDSVKNAVIFSADVLGCPGLGDDLPQYGLLGSSNLTCSSTIMDSRLYLNTNIPFSAFVCGVQGSGKSHTTACMIENCLIASPVLGVLQKPLSALVFNFAEYTSESSFRPCELAFLTSPGTEFARHLSVKKICVLVSPSNYLSMKALYTQIPGVTVQPFVLRPEDLNISTMLTLMSVNQTQATPLYMGTVTKILRDMASKPTGPFNYLEFRRQLDDAGLDRKQEEFLNQRLDLLESFLDLDGSTTSPKFAAGEITIMDLSCPFMDASTACVLFKVGMGLYLESDSATGKVIVLDEAHKYMTDTVASKALTESLMGVIRQQRHYGARVIISTQEPSISPKLIDLCSITIMHRFSSPEWLDILQRHILVSDEEGDRANKVGLLREIMRLKTGEALVFAPSATVGASHDAEGRRIGADILLRMRMRKRVTWDGGESILCI